MATFRSIDSDADLLCRYTGEMSWKNRNDAKTARFCALNLDAVGAMTAADVSGSRPIAQAGASDCDVYPRGRTWAGAVVGAFGMWFVGDQSLPRDAQVRDLDLPGSPQERHQRRDLARMRRVLSQQSACWHRRTGTLCREDWCDLHS